MKFVLFIAIVAIAFLLAACGEKQSGGNQDGYSNNSTPSNNERQHQEPIQGYILFVKDSERYILIRDKYFDTEDINLPLKEIQRKYKDIMFLTIEANKPKNLKSGQKVIIGVNKILESYPPIAIVTKIEIVEK
ncbi:YobA family protein [Bacillus sp. B-jedd]|uniref:YobA family protein n=1 Tax=Bacillus sp. B-jedd TaxID=1476857 RepID=UPI00051555F8|nr:YobA family protein [Bacillus sp. B-jedd]CEG26224.1 hypothetical protein BN1002_01066 [Bacillus sp. B-jedd]